MCALAPSFLLSLHAPVHIALGQTLCLLSLDLSSIFREDPPRHHQSPHNLNEERNKEVRRRNENENERRARIAIKQVPQQQEPVAQKWIFIISTKYLLLTLSLLWFVAVPSGGNLTPATHLRSLTANRVVAEGTAVLSRSCREGKGEKKREREMWREDQTSKTRKVAIHLP